MPEKPPYWQDHRRHTPLKRSVLTVSMREGRRVRTVLRAMRVRSTYARHRIRHGIRHTAVRAGRRPCPSVETTVCDTRPGCGNAAYSVKAVLMPEKPPYWQDHRRHTPLKRSVLTVSMREGRRVRTVLRAMRVRSTYARHRIRHGIRHTAVRAGRRPCPSVANDRLRHAARLHRPR